MMHQISSPLKFKLDSSSKISGLVKSSVRDLGEDPAENTASRLKELISSHSKQPYDDVSGGEVDLLDFPKDPKMTKTEMNFKKGDKPYDETSYHAPKSVGPKESL